MKKMYNITYSMNQGEEKKLTLFAKDGSKIEYTELK